MINIRPAIPNDSDFVYQVKVDALKDYIAKTWGWDDVAQQEFHRNAFRSEKIQIISHDEVDAGFLVVEEREEEIRLNEINLLKRFQGNGIGSEIIRAIQRDAARHGKRIWLQVLKVNPAIRLYERLGFRTYAETDTHYQMIHGEQPDEVNECSAIAPHS